MNSDCTGLLGSPEFKAEQHSRLLRKKAKIVMRIDIVTFLLLIAFKVVRCQSRWVMQKGTLGDLRGVFMVHVIDSQKKVLRWSGEQVEVRAEDEVQATGSSSSEKLQDLSFDEWDTQDSDSSSSSDSDTNGSGGDSKDDSCPPTVGDGFSSVGYRLLSLVLLFTATSSFCICKSCKNGNDIVTEGKRNGLATSTMLKCSNCPAEKAVFMSPKLGATAFSEINRLIVFGMHLIGCGRQALVTFCAGLNMPTPMSRNSFAGHQKAPCSAAEKVAESSWTWS